MAFPASQQTLTDALALASRSATRIKTQVQSLRDASASGDTGRSSYVNLQRNITDAIDQWDQASTVPGIAQYARDQYDNQILDIAAEFNTMRAAAVTLRLWIFNNIPTASGAILLQSSNLEGNLTDLIVTTVATTQFRVEADAFTATIG